MNREQDKLIIRIVKIIEKLSGGEHLTTKELAEEFNVSVRVIQKDLNDRLSFLPIIRKNGVYSFESYVLGQLSIDDIKNFAILSGLRGLYPSLDDSFIADLLNKKINPFLVKGGSYENIEQYKKLFEVLELAILKHHKVSFTYNSKQRVVEAYKLVNINNLWYLAASEDGKIKTYSFTKLEGLKVLKETFTPNKEILALIQKDEMVWVSQKSIDVIIEVDEVAKEYFLKRDLLPSQTLLKETAKGLTLLAKVSYDEEILQIVKQWIPHLKIISPEYLQEKLHKDLSYYLSTAF